MFLGILSSFLKLPRSLQGSPSVAQLTSTCNPNILISGTQKPQRLDNFFQGKACAVYGISSEQHSSLHSSKASPDGALGSTVILGHLEDVFIGCGQHMQKTEERYGRRYPHNHQHASITG